MEAGDDVYLLLGLTNQPREEAHAAAMARGADCTRCPLYGCRQGPVLGEIRRGAPLTIIGEAPGGMEVEAGHPFVGPSGRDLEVSLNDGGLTRHDTSITNTILCRPPEEMQAYLRRLKIADEVAGRPPSPTPVECCAPRLKLDVAEAQSQTLLAVGASALRATAELLEVPYGAKKSKPGEPRINTLKRQIGAPVVLKDERVVVASYHPAFAMRKGSRQYRPVVRQHMARAAHIAARGGRIDWYEPPYISEPTIEDVERVCARLLAAGQRTSVDIETNGINTRTCQLRRVGLGATIDGEHVVISVPFRKMDGSDHWNPGDKLRAVIAVRAVLDALPLMGHNFAFDSAVLLRIGLLTDRRKTWDDSLLAHHDTDDNDLPHDLGFVTARYFESPFWKLDVDAKSVDGVTDEVEGRYNCKDVYAVMRLIPELEGTMSRLGTLQQYSTDTALAPIFRDMGELGLVVDRHERLRLLKELTGQCKGLTARLRDIVGRSDFNPHATAHVRWFLFGKLRLTPIFSTGVGGREWTEDEDPSTNVQSLLRLHEKYGLGDEPFPTRVRAFIDAMLEFRAYDKLRGTYVKNLNFTKEDWSWAGLGMLPVLHTIYKLHVIPSGRVSTEPAVQNWPERGKANMRKMITSPYGHVMVGADFDQLELRLYAIMAQDEPLLEAFKSGKDVHIWNYASLEAKHDHEIQGIYDKLFLLGKDNKVVKQNRNIAKRFVYLECLPLGTPVLTDAGVLPIESVELHHKLWDGVEWVSHDGVICKGEKEVITHDGLTATADHKVWLENGGAALLGDAARRGARLARTATPDGQPLPFMGDVRIGFSLGGATLHRGRVPMRAAAARLARKLAARQKWRLSQLQQGEGNYAAVAPLSSLLYETALREPAASSVPLLRRARNPVQIPFSACGGALDSREPRTPSRIRVRPNRQQWPLRAGQPALHNASVQQHESVEHEASGGLGLRSDGMALRREARPQDALSRAQSRADSRDRASVHDAQGQDVASNRNLVRVYDILNAGPRRRFTASGRLVSNCYGGEEDKLFQVMSTERDKATGVLTFPDIKESDVKRWHENWHRWHPATKRWQNACKLAYYTHGYTSSILDYRKRFHPGGLNKQNALANHVIQASGAALANRSIQIVDHEIPHRGWSPFSGLMLQVHDSMTVYCETGRAERAARIIEGAMAFEYEGMKFTAKAKISQCWADQ